MKKDSARKTRPRHTLAAAISTIALERAADTFVHEFDKSKPANTPTMCSPSEDAEHEQ